MRRSVTAVLLMLGSVCVFGTVWAIPASASDPTNCAFLLQPASSVPVQLGCYATFAQALAEGSGGSIQVPATTTPAALTDATLQTDSVAAPAASVLIGTEWTNINYTGGSNSYFAASTCTASTTWQVSYVTDAWNDVFSSGKGFGSCDVNKKFAASNFGGAVVTCTPNCSSYGSLNGEISSLRWRI
jgi:hypothetical protein